MANTYTQINIHAVFAVRHRVCVIRSPWREELFCYISGILREVAGYPLAVGGWKDHVHIFFEQKASQSTADVVGTVKSNSAKWVNEQRLLPGKFGWQEGYGGFSHSRSQRDQVIGYIMNQEQHHRNKTFREEYLKMLDDFCIGHDPKYLFDFFE